MGLRQLLVLTACAVLAVPLAPPYATDAAAADAHALCRLADPQITEASGAAMGQRNPKVLFTHNDSGDTARLFAVDASTCKTIATYALPGVTAIDFEDIGVATDAAGVPSIYFADIGDNAHARSEIDLYRFDEPIVTPGTHFVSTANLWRLRYPDGPHDAEALLVEPGGRMFIVTKAIDQASVYAVPRRADAPRVRTMRHVTNLPLLLVTGGSVSPDGNLAVLRTYTTAETWVVQHGQLGAALRGPPGVATQLPAEPQGEGVAIRGGSMVLVSEQKHSQVLELPLPVADPDPPPPSESPTPSAAGGERHGLSALLVGVEAALAAVFLVLLVGFARAVIRR